MDGRGFKLKEPARQAMHYGRLDFLLRQLTLLTAETCRKNVELCLDRLDKDWIPVEKRPAAEREALRHASGTE